MPSVRFIPDRAMIFRDDWLQKMGGSRAEECRRIAGLVARFTKEDPDGHGKAGDTYGLGGWAGGGGGLWYSFPFFTICSAYHTRGA